MKINQTVIASGLNLVIELSKRNSGDSSNPVLLARLNDVPYVWCPSNTSFKSKENHLIEHQHNRNAADSDQFDDHDFLSNYRHDDNHRIVLDNVEIEDGMAVISVFNGAENLESVDLNYDITVSFKNSVDCPTGLNGQICSGRGTCAHWAA